MKGNYLSIGELARLKNVSIKSLRYYDRIGVLKPAWVNPDSGYRYYTYDQIIVLDVILLCIAFDLPLKNIADMGGAPDLKKIISEGQIHAERKMEEYRRKLELSRDIMEQIERLDAPAEDLQVYERRFGERAFLTRPWRSLDSRSSSASSYLKVVSDLHDEARERGLTILSQQGIIKDCRKCVDHVFLAVIPEGKDLLAIPPSLTACMVMEEKDLPRIPDILKEKDLDPDMVICLNTDVYDYCLTSDIHRMEVQLISL